MQSSMSMTVDIYFDAIFRIYQVVFSFIHRLITTMTEQRLYNQFSNHKDTLGLIYPTPESDAQADPGNSIINGPTVTIDVNNSH